MLPVFAFVFPVLLSIAVMVNLVMALILWKGQVCPGQRRRLIKQGRGLTALWFITLIVGMLQHQNMILMLWVAVAAIAYEFSRHQPVRERNALWLSAIVSIIAGMTALFMLSSKLVMLISFLTSGAAFTQTLMVLARCRLQAFYRLLPALGMLGILVACVNAVNVVSNVTVNDFSAIQYAIAAALLMLAMAFVIWVWPELSKEKPAIVRIAIVSAICLSSNLIDGAISTGFLH